MRGKGIISDKVDSIDGITPAYAGKRPRKKRIRNRIRDHPRLCGEKLSRRRMSLSGRGSPPPMRGKVHQHRYRTARSRITPAYAGKS